MAIGIAINNQNYTENPDLEDELKEQEDIDSEPSKSLIYVYDLKNCVFNDSDHIITKNATFSTIGGSS